MTAVSYGRVGDATHRRSVVYGTIQTLMAIRIKNVLTPHQRDRLRAIREGTELTGEEILVLALIIETANDVLELFEDLVEPAEGIILLAVIL